MVIDLNADLGEGLGSWRMGDDDALLRIVSSANVACGFHAGDAVTARATCTAAARYGVVVGAHVGYRDLAGFGRRFIDVEPHRLTDEVVYQIAALQGIAAVSGTRVQYVKPHGALYHAIGHDEGQASAVVRAVTELDPSLALVALPGSMVASLAAEAGLRVVLEAFADRAYTVDGGLVPRSVAGAVLTDPAVIADRVVGLASRGTVTAVDGSVIDVRAESVCVHGDTPGAVEVARRVRAALESAGVTVSSPL